MTFDIHKAAAWAALLSAIGGAGAYWHKSLGDSARAQQQNDKLYQRLGDDEANITFVQRQLPKDKREILEAIEETQQRSEREQARQEVALQKEVVGVIQHKGSYVVGYQVEGDATEAQHSEEKPAAKGPR